MMYRTNVYPVLGEHEYMAKKILPLIMNVRTLDEAEAMLTGESESVEKKTGLKTDFDNSLNKQNIIYQPINIPILRLYPCRREKFYPQMV